MDREEQIKQEIEKALGPQSEPHMVSVADSAGPGSAVLFKYIVPGGPLAGKLVDTGVSMDDGVRYPDAPPHFIHVPKGITYEHKERHYEFSVDGQSYDAYSNNCSEWNRIPKESRTMRAYINLQLARFWRYAK